MEGIEGEEGGSGGIDSSIQCVNATNIMIAATRATQKPKYRYELLENRLAPVSKESFEIWFCNPAAKIITDSKTINPPSPRTALWPLTGGVMTLPARPSMPPITTSIRAAVQYQAFVDVVMVDPNEVNSTWYRYKSVWTETGVPKIELEVFITHQGNAKLTKANKPPITPK